MKKVSVLWLFVGISLIINACKNKAEYVDASFSMNEVMESSSDLENEIINNGSIEAYEKFRIAYLDDKGYGDFYKMAVVMADEYYYIPANYDVFSLLYDKQSANENFKISKEFSLEFLDSNDRETALQYLKKGAGYNDRQCVEIVKRYVSQNQYGFDN